MRWTCWGAAAVLSIMLLSTLVGTATADWSGNAEIGPTEVRQSSKYECTVGLVNTGTMPLHVTEVIYSIVWPYEPIMEGQTRPRGNFTIFQGDVVIPPGETHDFIAKVNSGGWYGGMNTEAIVTAHAEGEPSSVQVFEGNINIRAATGEELEQDSMPWVIGSVVVLLVFLVVLAYYYKKNDIPPYVPLWWARPRTRINQIRKCPSCDQEIPADSAMCPYCGRKM